VDVQDLVGDLADRLDHRKPERQIRTKWLSITSTCIASELGTLSIAVCRFAKSADRMLGMILGATVETLVGPRLAEVGREHRVGTVSMRPELQVRPKSSIRNLGQQLASWNHLDVAVYGEGSFSTSVVSRRCGEQVR
jgi:hypothetical protein